jgi:hypothetical protein
MARRLLPLAALAALAACGGSSGGGLPVPCRCQAGQKCLADGRTCADLGYVDPVGTPATCAAPVLLAGPELGPAASPGCVKPVGASSLPAAPPGGHGLVDLGFRTVGEVATFRVPPGTASFTIVEQADPSPPDPILPAPETVNARVGSGLVEVNNVAVPDQLRDPSGALVYDDVNAPLPPDPAASGTLAYFASFSASVTGTFTFPATSRALEVVGAGGVAAGDWTFRVNDWAYECATNAGLCDAASGRADSRYRVYVLTKAAAASGPSAVPAQGTLDVAFHLLDATPPPGGLTAQGALRNGSVQRMVDGRATLLGRGGVCLGEVTFHDAPAWAVDLFATGVDADDGSPCGNLAQLLTLSAEPAGTPVPRLHLFLVSRIVSSSQDGTRVVGVDGTVPGPASVNGTVRSGAAVSMESLLGGTCTASFSPLTCGADFTAYIAAHEAGHYLGLYHTTESSGARFDPVADTPRCVCALCASSPSLCGSATFVFGQGSCNQGVEPCSGGRNLMFWILGSGGILSPDQGRILRASPSVRHP